MLIMDYIKCLIVIVFFMVSCQSEKTYNLDAEIPLQSVIKMWNFFCAKCKGKKGSIPGENGLSHRFIPWE